MAARRERGLFDPDPPPGESLFDHDIFVFASDGDLEEGVSSRGLVARRPPAARATSPCCTTTTRSRSRTTPTIAFSEDVAKRYEAYGWHVQTVDWTNDGKSTRRTSRPCTTAFQAAKAETRRPSFIQLAHDHRLAGADPAEHLQGARQRARARTEVAATKKVLGFDPEQTFQVERRRDHPYPAGHRARQGGAVAVAGGVRRLGGQGRRPQAALYDRMRTRTLPDGWADALPDLRARARRASPPARRPATS